MFLMAVRLPRLRRFRSSQACRQGALPALLLLLTIAALPSPLHATITAYTAPLPPANFPFSASSTVPLSNTSSETLSLEPALQVARHPPPRMHPPVSVLPFAKHRPPPHSPPSPPPPSPPPPFLNPPHGIFNVLSLGATGNGRVLDTSTVSNTLAAACYWARRREGTATVVFPANHWFRILPVALYGPCGRGLQVKVGA